METVYSATVLGSSVYLILWFYEATVVGSTHLGQLDCGRLVDSLAAFVAIDLVGMSTSSPLSKLARTVQYARLMSSSGN
jgi:hypothetical protein